MLVTLSILALVALGLWLALAGAVRLLRGRPMAGLGRLVAGGSLCALAAVAGAVALNLYTYHRLSQERLVAELALTTIGPQHYRVRLSYPDGETRDFELRGDDWQLDARILRWQGLATLLGMDTLYRVERVSGRYAQVEQELTAPRTVYALATNAGADLWGLARRHKDWLPWVDAVYGSATYMPLADDAHYDVLVSGSGLLARPSNAAARRALAAW
jgi:hypothetical protein